MAQAARKSPSAAELAHRWYAVDGSQEACDAMFALVGHLENSATDSRRWLDHTFYRVATGRILPRAYAYSMGRTSMTTLDLAFGAYKAPSFNVISSCMGMLAAKISRNKPWILYLTDEGDFKARLKGKLLSKYNDGLWVDLRTYEMTQQAFKDAFIFGDGWIKVYIEAGEIKHERVLSSELFVDDSEAIHGKPKTLYQIRYQHREDLMAIYGGGSGERAAFITDSITNAPGAYSPGYNGNGSDMIALVEAWHLPDVDGNGGRRLYGIPGCFLDDEPWTKTGFPFARFPWEPLSKGYFSKGAVEELLEIQNRINRISTTIDDAQIRMGVPRVLVEKNSKVSAASLANKIGGIVPYDTVKPEFIVPQAIAPELYAYRETLKQEAYQQIGVNQLSAAGMKQVGINSGEAQRVRHDIESERFVLFAQHFEQFHIDLSRLDIEAAKEIKPKVRVPGRGFMREIAWDQVNLDENEYEPRAFPISSLPTSPDGRLQRASELRDLGVFSNDDYARLIGYPDTNAQLAKQTAPTDMIEAMLDAMVEDGTYYPPEKYMDPVHAVQIATWRYAYERLHKTPEDRLDLIRRFIEQCGSISTPPITPPSVLQPSQPPVISGAPVGGPEIPAGGPLAPLPMGINPQIQSELPAIGPPALQ